MARTQTVHLSRLQPGIEISTHSMAINNCNIFPFLVLFLQFFNPTFFAGVFPQRPPLDPPENSHWGEALQVPVLSLLRVQERHDYQVCRIIITITITITITLTITITIITILTRHMRTHSRYSMGDAAALVEAAQREAALKLEPMEV